MGINVLMSTKYFSVVKFTEYDVFQAVSRKLRICHVNYRDSLSLFIDYSFKTEESKRLTPPSTKDIAILHLLFAFVHSKILTNNKISALGLIYSFINIKQFCSTK